MRRTPPRGASLPSLRLCGQASWLAFAMVIGGLTTAAAQTPEQLLLEQDKIDLTGRTSLTFGSGARAFGMGGAFLARADDATAASWNPAGLSYLRVPQVSLAGNRTLYRKETETDLGVDRDRFAGQTPDFAALTWPVRIGGLSGAIQASLQRTVPFGGSFTKVRQRSDAREAVESAGDASGGFDVLTFGTGWLVTRTLLGGVTFNRWFNSYTPTLDRNVPAAVCAPPPGFLGAAPVPGPQQTPGQQRPDPVRRRVRLHHEPVQAASARRLLQ